MKGQHGTSAKMSAADEDANPRLVIPSPSCSPLSLLSRRPGDKAQNDEAWLWVDQLDTAGSSENNGCTISCSMMVSMDQTHLTIRPVRDADRWFHRMPALRTSLMDSLQVLDLIDCRYIKQLDDSIAQCVNLEHIQIKRCYLLNSIPNDLSRLQKLKEIKIVDAPLLQKLPDTLGNPSRLERLTITSTSGYQNKLLTHLPCNLGTSLREIVLDKCKSLEALPESIGNLTNLSRLVLREAKALETLPSSLGQCKGLVELNLLKCTRLVSLPTTLARLPRLEDLILMKCKALSSLWNGGDCEIALPYLGVLDIKHCKSLVSLPTKLTRACPRLHVVWACDCSNLMSMPDDLLPQLSLWDFTGCPSLVWPETADAMPRQCSSIPRKRQRSDSISDAREDVEMDVSRFALSPSVM